MPIRIGTRRLRISMLPSGLSPAQEGIEYQLADMPWDEVVPQPICRPVRWNSISRLVEEVKDEAADLITRASRGEPRGDRDLEARLQTLAARLMPETGLAEIMSVLSPALDDGTAVEAQGECAKVLQPGVHPWLDIDRAEVANIPWEALPESYAYCEAPGCPLHRKPAPVPPASGDAAPVCPTCRRPLRVITRNLGAGWHVCHVVHSDRITPPPTGREMLIVADPTEDLCDPRNDPEGKCSRHLAAVSDLLKRHGYDVLWLANGGATVSAVLEAIQKPTVVGLYYFGHGFVEEGNESCLVLAKHQRLYATDIEDGEGAKTPRMRFVFLNACHAAAAGHDWGFHRPIRSIAHAFARNGKSKVVIAPIWPVLNVHAADMATAFFQAALRGARLSKALQWARRRSYSRYSDPRVLAPEFSWAAYRYFGDPDRRLPPPDESESKSRPAPAKKPPCRLFNDEGRLSTDLFSFGIDEVLMRAAKRRNMQKRRRATRRDLLAGLIRRGELTRFVLGHFGLDPDKLYQQFAKVQETESAEAAAADPEPSPETQAKPTTPLETIRREIRRWIIRDRNAIADDLAQLLCRADEFAQRGDGLISERQVLEAFLEKGAWDDNKPLKLPLSAQVRQFLDSRERCAAFGDDGSIVLDDLSSAARRVIDKAHALAQQRGTREVGSRLLFAAFLDDPNGYAATLCKQWQVHTETLGAFLIASSGGKTPDTFPLGFEACRRVVQPMVDRARQLAASNTVSERVLFRAFCERAPEVLKRQLREMPTPWSVDLDVIVGKVDGGSEPSSPRKLEANIEFSPGEDPPKKDGPQPASGGRSEDTLRREEFDDTAWQVLVVAAHWARVQGSSAIRTPHLFAALVGGGVGTLGMLLRESGLEPETAKIMALLLVSPAPMKPNTEARFSVSPNVFQVFDRAIHAARREGRDQATLHDLCRAYLSGGPGVVGQQLKKVFGIDLKSRWRRDSNGGQRT